MSVRKLKPITPGQRFRVVNGFDAITTDKPEKSLLAPKKRSGGRNSQGRMTTRNIGGGHKQRYRIIDFKKDKNGIPATVKTIEYDPNRTAFIALLSYADGEKRYVIAQNGLNVGQVVVSGRMNPVDHPMGGGEGRASGGHPRSRNGIPAKGFKTRSKTKASNKYIIERRKK